MFRIDSETATPDHKFTEGNPVIPVPATTVTADWLNSVQEELAYVIEQADMELDKGNTTQLRAAIHALVPALVSATTAGLVPPSTTGMILGTDIYGNVVWRQWPLWDVGLLKPWESTTLPPDCCWPNGDFVSFADFPEVKWKYDNGFFAGKLLAYNADSTTIAANLGQWRPDAANPTGLFTPNIGDQFLRAWTAGLARAAGSWQTDQMRPITGESEGSGGATHSGLLVAGSSTSGAFYAGTAQPNNPGETTGGGNNLGLNSALLGVNYSGTETAPRHISQPVIIYLGRAA
jgi:hypothetical protein